MVRTVVAGAVAGGKVTRPWFGATARRVTAEIADSLGLARPRGALIEDVYPGGPAAQAGLRAGDIVTAIRDHEVNDPRALFFRLATYPIDGTVPLTVLRQGRERQAALPLAAPPETPPRQITPLGGRQPLAGATVANLSPALAVELDIEPLWQGVVVLEVAPATPAARLGVQPGDLVLRVNDRAIERVDALEDALRRNGRRGWRLAIRRGNRVLRITVGG
jgi:serine protease Do